MHWSESLFSSSLRAWRPKDKRNCRFLSTCYSLYGVKSLRVLLLHFALSVSGLVLFFPETLSEISSFRFCHSPRYFVYLPLYLPPSERVPLTRTLETPPQHIYTRTENFFLNQLLIRTTMRASYRSPDLAFPHFFFSLLYFFFSYIFSYFVPRGVWFSLDAV